VGVVVVVGWLMSENPLDALEQICVATGNAIEYVLHDLLSLTPLEYLENLAQIVGIFLCNLLRHYWSTRLF
jgi:uncharacterized membrane protein YecN with MAPEG domain